MMTPDALSFIGRSEMMKTDFSATSKGQGVQEESFSTVFHAMDKKVKSPSPNKTQKKEDQSQAAQAAQGPQSYNNREPVSSNPSKADSTNTTRQAVEGKESPAQPIGMPDGESATEMEIDLGLIMKRLDISEAEMPQIFKLGEAAVSPLSASSLPLLASPEKTAVSPMGSWRLPMLALQQEAMESQVVEQVIQKLSLRQMDLNGKGGVTMELEPKELGLLKVEISVHKGGVSAEIMTHHPAVKEIIEKNQSLLQDALHQAGFNIDQFSVNVGDFQNHAHSDMPWGGFQFSGMRETDFSATPLLAAIGEAVRGKVYPEGAVSLYV